MVGSVAARMLAALLGITVGLGMAEVGLRLFRPQRTGPLQLQGDSRYFSIHVPNLRGRETLPGVYTWVFTHDSAGRRITGASDKDKAAVRVLLLGDSFTYGMGVNDEETFAYLLQQRLARTGRSITVINAGNYGKGTDYALRFFELEGRGLRPAVTVLGFFTNDFRDNGRTKGPRLYRVNDDGTLTARVFRQPSSRVRLLRRQAYLWVVSWSHLANLIRTVAIGVRDAEPGVQDYADVRFVNEENSRATAIFLRRLAAVVREGGSDFLIFYFPTADEVKRYRETGEASVAEVRLRELVVPTGHALIALTPFLAASSEPLARLYYDEEKVGRPSGHWTPAGHAIVADVMYEHVWARVERRKPQGAGRVRP